MDKLTQLQENFCQAIVDGLNQTDAYKVAGYSVDNKLPATIHQAASRLAANSKVLARVVELRAAVTLAVTEKRVWDRVRLIDEAEANMLGAREDHAWAPANGALKLIGDATGLLEPRSQQQGAVTLNRIIVVLSGPAAEKAALMQGELETRVIDGTVLPDDNETG